VPALPRDEMAHQRLEGVALARRKSSCAQWRYTLTMPLSIRLAAKAEGGLLRR
jgi:hypothetical protein